ncbi:hypothetical protein B0H34DRAFT_716364 [Crassisporium funariophilum]|nr:hypothetical protein B0H34DRAFT_716364 [Crassisporium funariophilum]
MFSNLENALISGGTFIQNTNGGGTGKGFDVLIRNVASNAFHNSRDVYDTPKCHPNTRVAALATIMKWIQDPSTRRFLVMWLNGAAGAGKSAIARTIAEQCAELGLLLAGFFFSRTAGGRNTDQRLIANIAYQIHLNIPETRPHIELAIERDPFIFDRKLEAQILSLVIQPLRYATDAAPHETRSAWPKFIAIDGLDECSDAPAQLHILHVFCDLVRHHKLGIIILIASRAEAHLRAAFDIGHLSHNSARITLDNSLHPDADIEFFLRSKFTEIKNTHQFRSSIPESWPSSDTISMLVAKSSGQFIFASTVVRYIGVNHHRPVERLNIVCGLSPRDNDNPYGEIDALFTHIFASMKNVKTALRILRFHLFIQPFRLQDVLNTTFIKSDMNFYLAELQSVLIEPNEYDGGINFLHASLGDFLLDYWRSGEFWIRAAEGNDDAAVSILKLYRLKRLEGKSFLPIKHSQLLLKETSNISPLTVQVPYMFSVLKLQINNSTLSDALHEEILHPEFISAAFIRVHGCFLMHEFLEECIYLKYIWSVYPSSIP